jgi:hypothetical protein
MTYPEQEPLTPAGKVVGIIILVGFVALVFGGIYAAIKTGQPIIPYDPEVMKWELPWWAVN